MAGAWSRLVLGCFFHGKHRSYFFAWQAQHFVLLEATVAWQPQHFAAPGLHFAWQVQHPGSPGTVGARLVAAGPRLLLRGLHCGWQVCVAGTTCGASGTTFAWQVQHFAPPAPHFAWQVQHFDPLLG